MDVGGRAKHEDEGQLLKEAVAGRGAHTYTLLPVVVVVVVVVVIVVVVVVVAL